MFLDEYGTVLLEYGANFTYVEEEQFYLFYNPLKGEWRKTIDETDLPV
jgi:hypothetical protein